MASHTYTGEGILVRGRRFTLDVTSHRDEEVSYDVVDAATQVTLTEMSLDYYPRAADVEHLLDDLREALADDCLSSYFDGKHDVIREITTPLVDLSVAIENHYGGSTLKTSRQVTVPAPADLNDLQDWADEHLYPLTGTGQSSGNSAYDLTVLTSSEPALVGQTFDWGY